MMLRTTTITSIGVVTQGPASATLVTAAFAFASAGTASRHYSPPVLGKQLGTIFDAQLLLCL